MNRPAVLAPEQPDAKEALCRLRQHINLELSACGLPSCASAEDAGLLDTARELIEHYREQSRRLHDARCPTDLRIEQYLKEHFVGIPGDPLRLPDETLVLDRPGMARELSLPAFGDRFSSELLESYRCANGVLHNPKNDRRTTQGTFHITEDGLPFPADKKGVPRLVFANLFRRAFQAPDDYLSLPFTADQPVPARTFVSLLIRPLVCPEVPGYCKARSMETRFFAPGSLVSNLDFVETIFGNAGDPYLPEHDAGLDVEHWTGHTGCVILAPHLVHARKKDLGLPPWEQATERQRRDSMCWKKPDECYNDGVPFKLTCRTTDGVIVTLVADNYFGYCKKEVKTQISYAANLLGGVEEEHAGGAIAYASYNLGEEYRLSSYLTNGRTFAEVVRDYGDCMRLQPEGYGVDKKFEDLIYVPEDSQASLIEQSVRWTTSAGKQSIPLLPGKVYLSPSGYKVRLEKHPAAPSWRLIGTVAEGVFCHKPCTVSGGGKSEISKSLIDYMHFGPLYVADLEKDLERVEAIFSRDYLTRWKDGVRSKGGSRDILNPARSLGSVIKLLTPSADYSDEYNDWLQSIPNYVFAIVYVIKRFWHPSWGNDWRKHFSVDIVNGVPGHELKVNRRKIVGTYLRVGLAGKSAWRTFKIRQDFAAALKIQTEDDISASIVVPGGQISNFPEHDAARSWKFAVNCEDRLFQRPDDAVHRGLDRQTESDMSRTDNFLSNFEPLDRMQVAELIEKAIEFDTFTPPMQEMLRTVEEAGFGYAVSSAHPRLVDGVPSKNPRYLQLRPDLRRPFEKYVSEMGVRFHRKLPLGAPLHQPVGAVLMGRRNNPPERDKGIRSLAVYNPIHYQELPELFMDLICSLTGKSPSTTGAGSEGALTKGPFNALRLTPDLNTALVSAILTGLGGFSTAAGYIGAEVRVDHDISLLVPEIWCRLTPQERTPEFLIENGLLEKLEDYEHDGKPVLQSRLGYRITAQFLQRFFGRVFDNPNIVFDDRILKPEIQGRDDYADGIRYITEAQHRVAQQYFDDGSIDEACPPLQALLWIMATGKFEGKDVHHPAIRKMFTRDSLLASDWYHQRLRLKRELDGKLWKRHIASLRKFLADPTYGDKAATLAIAERLRAAEQELARVSAPEYVESLRGTLGSNPLGRSR